jgi:gas vesicle protein
LGQDPSELRAGIEETRERVGEEVDALSYKTDVGARVGDYVGEKKDAVTSKLSGAKDAATKPIPDRAQMRRARRAAEQNPLGLAVGGAAVGFVLGLLIPSTRVEDEKLGPASDKVGEVAREGWEQGKQVAQETAQGALEAAKESGSRHGEELSSTLQDRLPGEQEEQQQQQEKQQQQQQQGQQQRAQQQRRSRQPRQSPRG